VPLTRRQRAALDAVCETFVPGAVEIGVPEAFAETVASRRRPAEQADFARLLTLWDWPLAAGRRRFSALSHEGREDVLRSWRDSRFGVRRQAYKVFRKGTLAHAYGLPGAARELTGYPGPPPLPDRRPPSPVQGLVVDADTTLDCDVCVVGSGAGGGTAAGVLAGAGLDVVVLEAGPGWERGELGGDEFEGLRRLYLEAATSATEDQSLDFAAGGCLGGGTTVNWTTSFRTPDDVREEWAAHGVPAFAGEEFDRSLDAVWTRLGVNDEHSRPSVRDAVLERGLQALGWHVAATHRNVLGCEQGRLCGSCGLGCPVGAKQGVAETWLADAQAAGARVFVETQAERILVERGAASGVEARTTAGQAVSVRCPAVVAACGAFRTPALLLCSGLRNGNVGKHLHFHPVTILFGVFDEEIRPWEGPMQARYSEEHARLDGGFGVRYETNPLHPLVLGVMLPWDGAARTASLAAQYPHLCPIFPLVRDRDGGEVRVDRDGEAFARYRLSAFDREHLRRGFEGAARILEAAGARQVFSTHARRASYEPGRRGSLESFLADADAAGWEPNRVMLGSAHVLGTARMGGSPAGSACDPHGETWEVAGLVVCDGSAFPTSSGVNPMISIEAVAHMNASALAGRLT
jgi:long-chain-alcohol oxidase